MRLETASDHDHIRNEALLSQRTTPLLTARASRISDIHDLRLGRNQSRRFTSTSEALSLPLLFPQAGHSASASASLRSPPPMPLSPLPSRPPPPSTQSLPFCSLLSHPPPFAMAALDSLTLLSSLRPRHGLGPQVFVRSSIFARGKERQ